MATSISEVKTNIENTFGLINTRDATLFVQEATFAFLKTMGKSPSKEFSNTDDNLIYIIKDTQIPICRIKAYNSINPAMQDMGSNMLIVNVLTYKTEIHDKTGKIALKIIRNSEKMKIFTLDFCNEPLNELRTNIGKSFGSIDTANATSFVQEAAFAFLTTMKQNPSVYFSEAPQNDSNKHTIYIIKNENKQPLCRIEAYANISEMQQVTSTMLMVVVQSDETNIRDKTGKIALTIVRKSVPTRVFIKRALNLKTTGNTI